MYRVTSPALMGISVITHSNKVANRYKRMFPGTKVERIDSRRPSNPWL